VSCALNIFHISVNLSLLLPPLPCYCIYSRC